MRRRAALPLTLLLAAGCLGPYPDLGEPLDQGIGVSGAAYVAGVPGGALRLLGLGGAPTSTAAIPFSLTIVDTTHLVQPVRTLQGSWAAAPGGAAAEAHATVEFLMPDESSESVATRAGATRSVIDLRQTVTVQLAPDGRLTLSGGDGSFGGVYLPLAQALGHLGRSGSPEDASCAYQVANLTVISSQARIPGFGGMGMLEYTSTAAFAGTSSGGLTVKLESPFAPRTDITFTGFADFDGMVADGLQVTDVNLSGDGRMSGVLTFHLTPAPGPPMAVSLDYGNVSLANGVPTGGTYGVSVDAQPAVQLSATAMPRVPATATCLGLP